MQKMFDDSRYRIRWSQVALRALFFVYTLILVCWCALTLVSASDIPTQFWLATEIAYLYVLTVSIGIAGRWSSDIARTLSFIPICTVASIGIAAKNVTHLILVAIQLANNTNSPFFWYLFALDILLGILVLLDLLALYHLYRYRLNLEYARIKKK
jgi:hypothetical protein